MKTYLVQYVGRPYSPPDFTITAATLDEPVQVFETELAHLFVWQIMFHNGCWLHIGLQKPLFKVVLYEENGTNAEKPIPFWMCVDDTEDIRLLRFFPRESSKPGDDAAWVTAAEALHAAMESKASFRGEAMSPEQMMESWIAAIHADLPWSRYMAFLPPEEITGKRENLEGEQEEQLLCIMLRLLDGSELFIYPTGTSLTAPERPLEDMAQEAEAALPQPLTYAFAEYRSVSQQRH